MLLLPQIIPSTTEGLTLDTVNEEALVLQLERELEKKQAEAKEWMKGASVAGKIPVSNVEVIEVDEDDEDNGVTVTLLDANHCPGSTMVLFQVPQKDGTLHNILHTGDCRWQPWMRDQPVLRDVQVDTLYLDTTYALPRHTFPPQQTAIDLIVRAMQDARAQEPATLFVMAAYHIGKERAFMGAAKALGCKIWCSAEKRQVLGLLDLPADHMALLADREEEAGMHVVHMGLKPETLQPLLESGRWKQVLGIRPTGWTYRRSGLQVWREGAVVLYGVPYSEHSSWSELCDCVRRLRPTRIVPTVNAANSKASRAIVDRFAALMDLSRDPSRLDMYFTRTPQGTTCATAATNGLQPAGCAERSQGGAGASGGQECGVLVEHDDDCEDDRRPDDLPWQVDLGRDPAAGHACTPSNDSCSSAHAPATAAGLVGAPSPCIGGDVPSAGGAGPCSDMDAAPDVREQQRIWDAIQRENERVRRLQQSVTTAKAAAAAKRGGKRRQAPALAGRGIDPAAAGGWDDDGQCTSLAASQLAPPGSAAVQQPRPSAIQAKRRRRGAAVPGQHAQKGVTTGSCRGGAPGTPSPPGHATLETVSGTMVSSGGRTNSSSSSASPHAVPGLTPPSLFLGGTVSGGSALAPPVPTPPVWTLPALASAGQRTISAMFARLASSQGRG